MDSIAQATVVRAHVPLATLIAYETSLREMTDGKATFTEALHSWVEIDDPEPDDSEPGSSAIRAA